MKTAPIRAGKNVQSIEKQCWLAAELIEAGNYESAADALGGWWQGVGVKPDVSSVSEAEKANLLVTIGSLTGWLGSIKQIEGHQEAAKDLISAGIAVFEKLGDGDKIAEARSEMAICYWRTGEFSEARIILADALENFSGSNPLVKAKLLLRLVNVEISSHNYEQADFLLDKVAPLIARQDSFVLQGKYHFHKALVYSQLDQDAQNNSNLEKVVEHYEKAANYAEKAGNYRYRASIENNAGMVLIRLGRNQEARRHINSAIRYYISVNDKGLAAASYDTKALAYLGDGNMEAAERAAVASVKMFEEGDEVTLLAESMTTLGTVYARQNRYARAVTTYKEAFALLQQVEDAEDSGELLLTWLEELGNQMSPEEYRELYLRADELLADSPRAAILKRMKDLAVHVAPEAAEELSSFVPDSQVLSAIANRPFPWDGFCLHTMVRNWANEIESSYITRALNESRGSVTRAAALLGISHQSLSILLKQRHSGLAHIKKPRKRRTVRPKA
jgi:tetratricopeptide (TPR) repeat protein